MSRGTDRSSIRIDPELWAEFGEATAEQPGGRSEVLREYIRWYLKKPGAELPQRPAGAEAPE